MAEAHSTELVSRLQSYETGDATLIHLLGAAADEIMRLDADAACERAEKESLKLEVERLRKLAKDFEDARSPVPEQDLPLGRWVSLTDILPLLRERMSYNDGGRFILQHWDCKYINARIDMRTGAVYLTPGSGPDAVHTKLAQAKHTIADLRDLLRCVLVSGRLTGHMLADEIRALDVSDDGKCWIKGCQQPKGHAGFCDPLPDPRSVTQEK